MSSQVSQTLVRMRHLQPLASLSPEHLEDLLSNCRQETLARGEHSELFHAGSDNALYLAEGEIRLAYPDGSAEVLVGGCGKACWPLGQAGPRPLRGRSITDVMLIHVDGVALDQLLTWGQSLDGAAAQGHGLQQLPAALLTRGALAGFPPAHIDALLASFSPMPVTAGQVVVQEGDEGDAYYLIESGRAQVVRQVGGSELLVAELGPGQAFGEESLVSGERRNATVRMSTGGRLLRLAKPDFLTLLKAPLLKSVTREEAGALIGSGARWLDVRYPAEFGLDGLPGALNIPLNQIRNSFALLPREQTYIVYCRTGRRSAAAAFLLAQQGFDAHWLEGGLPDATS